jgi:hypothetical protein
VKSGIAADEPTPVIFDEFKEHCTSQYVISDKDSDSAISSDGEFIDACKIQVYDEDDSHIDQIEQILTDKSLRDSIYHQGTMYQKPAKGRFISLMTGKKVPASDKENQGGFLNHSQTMQLGGASFSQDSFMPVKEPPRTKRDKGLKFFKKVGYTKDRMKAIPRWCTEMDLLDRMVIYQKRNP